MTLNALGKYLDLFGRLHRHSKDAVGAAPHKPVLLLALLAEIERGHIAHNLIPITPELVAAFRFYWRTLVPTGAWQERFVYPFRYLIRDGFWELVKDGIPQTRKELGDPTSINQLSAQINGGRFAPDLWELLQDRTAIHALRASLLAQYFKIEAAGQQPQLPANPLDYEAERLIKAAESKFRPYRVRETSDSDGYYVRHALFPKVVKDLYHETCAICGLNARADVSGGIVDAAHIMPFAEFHNDDPRNGIALCKNHHWGLDRGWFAISDDYKTLISPQLQNGLLYITPGTTLLLPSQIQYAPAPDALRWHRDQKFLRAHEAKKS